ncbi:MAG TPA: PASTA domain-containing protein, partial [Elusimicrobiota bacterium]|nr:PASTA domain-containing protein [Elusimicrobiota bacterium]
MSANTKNATHLEMAAVGAAFLAFAFWAVNWGIEGLVHNRKTQTVPDLKGRSISAALDELSPLNLGLRKTGVEFDASVPIASILRQDPSAGTVVREGKTVRVVVSQGGQTVQAPTVIGLPLRNAEMLLRQNQLALGEVSEAYSLKSEKGMVLSQDPKGETSVE